MSYDVIHAVQVLSPALDVQVQYQVEIKTQDYKICAMISDGSYYRVKTETFEYRDPITHAPTGTITRVTTLTSDLLLVDIHSCTYSVETSGDSGGGELFDGDTVYSDPVDLDDDIYDAAITLVEALTPSTGAVNLVLGPDKGWNKIVPVDLVDLPIGPISEVFLFSPDLVRVTLSRFKFVMTQHIAPYHVRWQTHRRDPDDGTSLATPDDFDVQLLNTFRESDWFDLEAAHGEQLRVEQVAFYMPWLEALP